jgi:hypothetical protein
MWALLRQIGVVPESFMRLAYPDCVAVAARALPARTVAIHAGRRPDSVSMSMCSAL